MKVFAHLNAIRTEALNENGNGGALVSSFVPGSKIPCCAVVAVIAVATLLSRSVARSVGPILEAISWPFSRAKERYFGPLLIFSIPQ